MPSTNTSKRTTAHFPFFSCGPDGPALFAVRKDISALHALEQASDFLAAARRIADDTAKEAVSETAWATVYLIEMSKAIVDAAILARD
jgi:hypothetical protein